MPKENIHEDNIEEKAKLEARVRREVMNLFIEEAKLEARAKEQKQRLLEEKEEKLKNKTAKSEVASKKEAQIIKISPKEEQLELDLEALKAKAKIDDRIKREKRKGKRIIQGAFVLCAIIILTTIAILNSPKEVTAQYDLVKIKECLQRSSSYYGQFKVEDVILSGENPSATLSLGFSPTTESDLKDFVESLVKRYTMARPGEKIDLLLKRDQRVYAKASYIPRTNTIDIELMK
ncbi:MAG: hypothetical protein ABH847_03415 [Candidatus Omnitrophota bacterium]